MAYELFSVSRGLEIGVAPCRIRERAVPQVGCGVEKHPALEGLANSLVGPAPGLIEYISWRKVFFRFVKQAYDFVHYIVIMVSSREFFDRRTGFDIFVDNRDGTEHFQSESIIICFQEIRMGLIQYPVFVCNA